MSSASFSDSIRNWLAGSRRRAIFVCAIASSMTLRFCLTTAMVVESRLRASLVDDDEQPRDLAVVRLLGGRLVGGQLDRLTGEPVDRRRRLTGGPVDRWTGINRRRYGDRRRNSGRRTESCVCRRSTGRPVHRSTFHPVRHRRGDRDQSRGGEAKDEWIRPAARATGTRARKREHGCLDALGDARPQIAARNELRQIRGVDAQATQIGEQRPAVGAPHGVRFDRGARRFVDIAARGNRRGAR